MTVPLVLVAHGSRDDAAHACVEEIADGVRAALPGRGNDEHAVETAVARLRSALGDPRLVQTVVKRGYRLALDPAAGPVPVGGHCLHGDAV